MRRPDKEYGTIRLACRYGVKDCTPSAGSLPESGEVYLKLPIKMKPIFGEGTLLVDTITTIIGNKYKVSGVEYFYDNGKDAEMLIREDDFERMTLREFFATKAGNFSISCGIAFKDGGFTKYTSGSIVINEELSGNEIAIVGEYSADDILSVDEFSLRVYDGYYMGGEKEYSFEGVYNAVKSYQLTERYMNGKEENSYLLWGVHISPDLALQLLESSVKKTYPQSSLFFENDKIAKQACEGLKEEGYLTLTTDAFYFNVEERLLDIIMGVFYVFLWVVAIVFLCFFLSLCISKNVDTLKKDVGILRSMGIKNSAIKTSMFSIMALSAIPALIVFAAVAVAVYTSPTMNPLVPFIHAPQYAFIVIGMLIIVMRLAGSNKKKIFRQSVRKTLRGGNGE